MPRRTLTDALADVRRHLLDQDTLVRAVGSGRRKGRWPAWKRVEFRWVDLKAGRRLQVTRYDETQAHTSNHAPGADLDTVLDEVLAEPFGNWHVDTTALEQQVRITKRGEALVHTRQTVPPGSTDGSGATDDGVAVGPDRGHDRTKRRLLPEDDPVLARLGIADENGRIKPSRQAKYRQVEEFLRVLDASIDAALGSQLRRPTPADPLRIVDLGCGNGYLTFAAQRYLTQHRGLPVQMIGVDVKQQSRDHNSAVAAELDLDATFVVGSIADADLATLPQPVAAPDVVLALHACDTATDDALARAVTWQAPLVLAAPCCHHDIAAQLRRAPAPTAYAELVRHGILRERFADTLTDAVRSLLLQRAGYRTDVMEFVDSQHTPRNTLLRAVRTGRPSGSAEEEYAALVAQWRVRPKLAELLDVPQ